MNDIFRSDVFKDVDPTFLQKLDRTITSMQGKSDLEIIGTFMALSNEATQRGIQMTQDQQKALMSILRDSLPPEKRPKFDMMMSMMGG